MCGITGFITIQKENGLTTTDELYQTINKMTDTLIHRGPDSRGIWIDQDLGIALGHRRLSIMDLTPEGHQPMESRNERYMVVFNGEIYNYESIKKELVNKDSSLRFRGNSDTEVMLAAFEMWGIKRSVEKFIGMFAFAIWDKKERKLYLGRDRAGEKPLYYGWIGKNFVFASELKAICLYPSFKKEIDRNALALYVRHSYIPAPYTIYQNIKKLEPGKILCLDYYNQNIEFNTFWSIKKVVENGLINPFRQSEQDLIEQLNDLLLSVVKQQMITSDVPVGAFLSGGIDSSTIVALMQAQSSNPIRTYSIGFNEDKYNEAHHAKLVAQHLGTNHTELYVTPQQALNVIPLLPTLYDEPFSDPSQIPTYLVSKLAKQHVTVSLTGDAGDELFGGYSRYIACSRVWNKINKLPYSFKKIISNTSLSIDENRLDLIFYGLGLKDMLFGSRVHSIAHMLLGENIETVYRQFVSHWKSPLQLVNNSREVSNVFIDRNYHIQTGKSYEKMMYLDFLSYLTDDILVKVDRASMGVSLESRVPLLDNRVIEFAWKLPISMKIKDNKGKWILRQVLNKYVPKELVERPKMGFGVPIDLWIRGPLKEWGEELLDEHRLKQQGFFDAKQVRGKWEDHILGKRDWQYNLWDILMFQAWLDKQ